MFLFKNRKILACLFALLALVGGCSKRAEERPPWGRAATLAGLGREFGEPFGLAVREGAVYVSDGERGKIWRVLKDGKIESVTDRLDTPSAIAFDREGFLVVADAGSHTIRRVNVQSGEVTTLAGTENRKGDADGDAAGQALFNAPVGVAVAEGKIYVADTYNDKIRLVENGRVTTLAGGGGPGFADSDAAAGGGLSAKFDTPCGVAVAADGTLVVADSGNRRLRRVDPARGGATTTIAGTGESDLWDGLPGDAKFVAPIAVAADKNSAIYVADGNSVRALGRRLFPLVETVAGGRRGYSDGALRSARFNRPAGLATDEDGNLYVADAENQTVRVLTGGNLGAEATADQVEKMRFTPEEFRSLQPPRWTYDPPEARRDVAGTLGEIRGEIAEGKTAWFHNGLDIAGGYGETARFIRAEKVLLPLGAAEGFGGLRERLRMPTVGYIHIRLGRDSSERPFGDARFQFSRAPDGKLSGVRVPRGARFAAGEAVGTLNSFNHVHLIAGRAGSEMNALDALVFPNISDRIAPVIEKVYLADENWREIETEGAGGRIKLNGKTRVVVRAFDRMDGNAAYRKLGVYRLGYQILKEDKTPVAPGEPEWTISFARLPADETAAPFVYAPGSQSGYSPVTIFDYVVTNHVRGDLIREDFFDAARLEPGNYVVRVFAADFFGNRAEREINVSLER